MLNHRIIYIILASLLVLESLLLFYAFYKLYKENNDINMIFKNGDVIQISDSPVIYISKRGNETKAFFDYMEKQGYKLIPEEQTGLRHCFKKDNENYFYILTRYKYYLEWEALK